MPGLVALCSAILPPEEGGPDPNELSWRVAEFVSRYPPTSREVVRALVAVAGTSTMIGVRGRADRVTPEKRAAVIERLATSTLLAGAIDAIKAMLLFVHGTDAAAAEIVERNLAVDLARPDSLLDVTPSNEWPTATHADAVVIGSGAGGAMVARTLARAGLDVVILEEGRRFSSDEFREGRPIDRFVDLYRDAGATIALGRPNVFLPVGRAVGGTTVVNSGTCFRPPANVQQRWFRNSGLAVSDPERLAPYLDEVEATLEIAPVAEDVMGLNGKTVIAGATKLGWSAGPLMRNASGCVGSCQCAIGCPRNAKAGVHMNALPDACKNGARIVSEARVDRILHEKGVAYGVRAVRPDGSTVEILAPRVVVAAGATETPSLLHRSSMTMHKRVGRNLAIHPASAVAALFEEKITAWHGVLQSAEVSEFHQRERLLIEATATPPGMGSVTLPGFGPRLMRSIENADRVVTAGAMIADEGAGRVVLGPRPFVTYSLTKGDAGRLIKSIDFIGQIMFAAGAIEVYTGILGHDTVRSISALADATAAADPAKMHLAAFHPTGTAAAGSDPERHPVDGIGRLRGFSGVWVADGSILPSCPEVNPQVSIMALALAIADGIAEGRVSTA